MKSADAASSSATVAVRMSAIRLAPARIGLPGILGSRIRVPANTTIITSRLFRSSSQANCQGADQPVGTATKCVSHAALAPGNDQDAVRRHGQLDRQN